MPKYRIDVDAGQGQKVDLTLDRKDLCEMIGGALLEGVLASMAIEGVPLEDIGLSPPSDLPTPLLVI